jgi:hypothetical protein
MSCRVLKTWAELNDKNLLGAYLLEIEFKVFITRCTSRSRINYKFNVICYYIKEYDKCCSNY